MEPTHKIDEEITTTDGFTFIVVDICENRYNASGFDYVVRADGEGKDASLSGGEEGIDWMYVYIPGEEIA